MATNLDLFKVGERLHDFMLQEHAPKMLLHVTPKNNGDMITAHALKEAIKSKNSPVLLSHEFEIKPIEMDQTTKELIEQLSKDLEQHKERMFKVIGIPKQIGQMQQSAILQEMKVYMWPKIEESDLYLNFRMGQPITFEADWGDMFSKDDDEDWSEEYIEGQEYKTKPL